MLTIFAICTIPILTNCFSILLNKAFAVVVVVVVVVVVEVVELVVISLVVVVVPVDDFVVIVVAFVVAAEVDVQEAHRPAAEAALQLHACIY